MTLLANIEELRKLEKKAASFPWSFGCITAEHTQFSRIYDVEAKMVAQMRPDRKHTNEPSAIPDQDLDDARFICAFRNAAPDLLDALDFRQGDADGLSLLIEWLDAMQKSSGFVISPELMQLLIRYRGMARAMEEKR